MECIDDMYGLVDDYYSIEIAALIMFLIWSREFCQRRQIDFHFFIIGINSREFYTKKHNLCW